MKKTVGTIFFTGLILVMAYVANQTAKKVQNKTAAQDKTKSVARNVEGANLIDRRDSSTKVQTLGIASVARDDGGSTFTPRVIETLQLAARLERAGVDAEAINAQSDKIAQDLTLADAVQLQALALSAQRSHNVRYMSVYLLSQRPEVFSHQLESVASSENAILTAQVEPHTSGETQRHFEEALRAQALTALDRLNTESRREEAFFTDLQATHSSPFVRKLARMGALGAKRGQSLINQYVNIER